MFFEFEYFECSERIGACDTNSKELNLLYDQDRTCFLLSSLCIAVQFFAMFSVFLFLFLNIRIRLVPLLFLQFWCSIYRSSHSQLFFKIGVLENAATREKETPTQLFSYDYCDIFYNYFFIEHLWWLLLQFFMFPSC